MKKQMLSLAALVTFFVSATALAGSSSGPNGTHVGKIQEREAQMEQREVRSADAKAQLDKEEKKEDAADARAAELLK